jgi:hypothetical protein
MYFIYQIITLKNLNIIGYENRNGSQQADYYLY